MRKLESSFAQQFPLISSLVTTRQTLLLGWMAFLYVVVSYGMYAEIVINAKDLFTRHGPMIGGDFVVFRTAGSVAGTSEMVDIYQMSNLSAKLRAAYPGHGSMMVGWQYPPTMYLFVRPLALLPHTAAFLAWMAALLAIFGVTLRSLWSNRTALLLSLASPAIFESIITGQTGLLTGTLVALAAANADRRPVLAGVAAGLLTVKPQLGLLIPVAFIAAGCWRAFVAAAMTTALLIGASVAFYGIEPWQAFLQAVTAHGDRLGWETGFPFFKLVTPFGATRVLGLPPGLAGWVQGGTTLLLVVYIAIAWRRVRSADLRLAALATSILLATPYAFYYEIAVLVPPTLLIARRGSEDGWLPWERLSLVALWVLALSVPGAESIPALPNSFALALCAWLIAARRVIPAARSETSLAASVRRSHGARQAAV